MKVKKGTFSKKCLNFIADTQEHEHESLRNRKEDRQIFMAAFSQTAAEAQHQLSDQFHQSECRDSWGLCSSNDIERVC